MAATGGSMNLKTIVFDGSDSFAMEILSISIVSFILFIIGFYKLIKANYHIIKESLISRKYLIAINLLAIVLEIGCILFLQ
jgi:divalent metal cation (Fe/Co/Zn/Cd) transporter